MFVLSLINNNIRTGGKFIATPVSSLRKIRTKCPFSEASTYSHSHLPPHQFSCRLSTLISKSSIAPGSYTSSVKSTFSSSSFSKFYRCVTLVGSSDQPRSLSQLKGKDYSHHQHAEFASLVRSDRLVTDYRQRTMAMGRGPHMAVTKCADQNYDFLLILDFEATCDNKQQIHPQEIIEFPVLKLNLRTQSIDSMFHMYVLPQSHPLLTPFCTELTGIIQDMVNGQPHLPQVLQSFHDWMGTENLLNSEIRSIFVTCGDWDLKTMLPKQCAHLGLTSPSYFSQWINIKKSFADVTGRFPRGIIDMLKILNMKHIGRHHSGIDDCHNIANIVKDLLTRGYVFKQNGRL